MVPSTSRREPFQLHPAPHIIQADHSPAHPCSRRPPLPTKLQRLLDLLLYLAGRRYPVEIDRVMEAVPAYAERWREGDETERASVRRAFERDKDELRALGVPIETAAIGRDGTEYGYRLRPGDLYLPVVRLLRDADVSGGYRGRSPGEILLHPHEASAALEGLRHLAALPGSPFADAARSAYRKLTFDLDPGLLPGTPVVFATGATGARGDVAERVAVLSDALRQRKRVRFRYRGIERDRPIDRDVAPWGLMYRGGAWYLVGHDALRDAVRTFRVGRMEDDPVPNAAMPRTPDYDVPADFDFAAYAQRQPWELGDDGDRPLAARVHFHFPASVHAERNGWGQAVEERDDGSAVRDFQVRDRDAFLEWILSFAGRAEVQLPGEWAVELRRRARQIAAAHAPEVRPRNG